MASKPSTADPQVPPLVCGSCNLSARFLPLYRFNQSGDLAQILLTHPATIMCANPGCHQVYTWVDDGWVRTSTLADLELVRS